jgi:hypothetical protein
MDPVCPSMSDYQADSIETELALGVNGLRSRWTVLILLYVCAAALSVV